MKHASIIPLIGGEVIGAERAFGKRPEYLISYDEFWNNDRHIVNYYDNEVPYYSITKGEKPHVQVDVIGSVCPCAGLSQMHHHYGENNQNNRWLIQSTEYVLGALKPQVLYGENAPGFAGKIGAGIREQMRQIGINYGYAMSVYRTKSLLHGVPQVRERSFYFFWKGDKVPVFNFYDTKHTLIEEVIATARGNTLQEPINKKTPSQDPWYRFILEEIHGGITHAQFAKILEPAKARGNDTFSYIEKQGYTYDTVSKWMKDKGFEREAANALRKKEKIDCGGNIMRRGTVVPKDYIGAFVGHYPTSLTHPVEDRYITYREALSIMGMPDNFELLDAGLKTANHICQNVPVQTAHDMAFEIKESLLGRRKYVDSKYFFGYNHSKTYECMDDYKTASLKEFI